MCDDLSSPSQAAVPLQAHLKSHWWEVNTNMIRGPGQPVKYLGVIWLGNMKMMPKAVID